jgi:hypothetical protein
MAVLFGSCVTAANILELKPGWLERALPRPGTVY